MANHIWEGKCSYFGGSKDTGVQPHEGLALIQNAKDAAKYEGFLLPGNLGYARRLNAENTHYIACRWNYKETSRAYLQSIRVIVENMKTGEKFSDVRPIDWGPNKKTGRIADLSPKLLHDLHLNTDDHVRVTIPLPAPKTKVS
jgi:hypothetical protein